MQTNRNNTTKSQNHSHTIRVPQLCLSPIQLSFCSLRKLCSDLCYSAAPLQASFQAVLGFNRPETDHQHPLFLLQITVDWWDQSFIGPRRPIFPPYKRPRQLLIVGVERYYQFRDFLRSSIGPCWIFLRLSSLQSRAFYSLPYAVAGLYYVGYIFWGLFVPSPVRSVSP